MSPSVTPAEHIPGHASTPAPILDPERAAVQASHPDPITHSPTVRTHTASPDRHEAPRTETNPTTISVTTTPKFELYDAHFIDSHSIPVRGDVLAPLQLPPLPTTRSQPSRLDISQGIEENGQIGSGRGESSGEGGGSDDRAGAAVSQTQVFVETTQSPSVLQENTPEYGLSSVMGAGGQQPAVVFKEDVTPGTALTFDLDKSPAVPDNEDSAKPPFHLIIVNVHDQNHSGEWAPL